MPFPQEIQIEDEPSPAGDPMGEVKAAIDRIRAAVSADGLDEDERLILEQITTLGQKLFTGRAKQEQAALGGGPATQFIKRAVGG
jgi:hypothetical protein